MLDRQPQGRVGWYTQEEAHILVILIDQVGDSRKDQIKGARANRNLKGRILAQGVVFSLKGCPQAAKGDPHGLA